jgi:hypothetical protein
MSMEQMVDALLPLGLMPAVVPEFKGITIGGSLQGLAAESTSFKYGIFKFICIDMYEYVHMCIYLYICTHIYGGFFTGTSGQNIIQIWYVHQGW